VIWDKRELVERWRECLRDKLDALQRGRDSARAGTRVDGDHRPENRGERASVSSQGYLAHGLAQRIAELQESLTQLDDMGCARRDRVRVGAVVQVEDEDSQPSWLAIFPGGDATVLEQNGRRLRVLSSTSPLARSLAGHEAGDCVEVTQGERESEFEVLAVL
jgi:transcription elongation GreA/GreB family factor